jgi:hypothetical protein
MTFAPWLFRLAISSQCSYQARTFANWSLAKQHVKGAVKGRDFGYNRNACDVGRP